MICRDRSGAYAEGARCGAPDAVQVADRFHRWQNLGKAVERCVARHRACLRAPDPAPETAPEPIEPQQQARPQQVPVSALEEAQPAGRFAERARRHHALVHDLLVQGHGIRAITCHLGWGRHTVQRYARATTWQELVDGRWQQQRPSKLDAFKPHLHQRWEQGCTNAAELYREVTALGFDGSYALVRGYVEPHRLTPQPAARPRQRSESPRD